MIKLTINNYTLTEKYHVPCIIMTDKDEFGEEDITEITYDSLEDAIGDMLFFCWEDRVFHGTTEFKQSKEKTAPKKYREILESRCPNIGFAKLNADVITGQK